jgi:HK97 family phage major capsid protein
MPNKEVDFPALESKRAEVQRIFKEAGPDANNIDNVKVFDAKGVELKTIGEKAARIRELNDEIAALQNVKDIATGGGSGSHEGGSFTGGSVGGRRTLKGRKEVRKGESVRDWLAQNGQIGRNDEQLSFDKYLKGIATGDWEGAQAELKAMGEGTPTAGGHMVPAPVAGQVIDLARNASRVFQAGATLVPMTSSTLKYARLTSDGAPSWKSEGATITGADLAFDSVTFTARTLVRLVTLSVELFEDAPNVGNVIGNSFAAQIGLELDRVALRGSGSAPEPRGIVNQTGVTLTAHGANGAAITNYDFHLDAVGAVRNNNFEPNAHIQAPRTSTSLSKLKEATTNAYMAPPANMLPMLPTKQVPVNLTVGTSSDCSEIFTGDFTQLLIGLRTGFTIKFLDQRYVADTLSYAFLAYLRADVQLAQPAAFNVDTGVRG